MLLTTTINDTMKQGDYVLVPEPEQVLVYDALTKALSWKWDLTQIQRFQHRRMASEVEITVGRLYAIVEVYRYIGLAKILAANMATFSILEIGIFTDISTDICTSTNELFLLMYCLVVTISFTVLITFLQVLWLFCCWLWFTMYVFCYITCEIHRKNSLLCISDQLSISASFEIMNIRKQKNLI